MNCLNNACTTLTSDRGVTSSGQRYRLWCLSMSCMRQALTETWTCHVDMWPGRELNMIGCLAQKAGAAPHHEHWTHTHVSLRTAYPGITHLSLHTLESDVHIASAAQHLACQAALPELASHQRSWRTLGGWTRSKERVPNVGVALESSLDGNKARVYGCGQGLRCCQDMNR